MTWSYAFDIYKRFKTLSKDKRVAVLAMMDQAYRIRRATGAPENVDEGTWRRLATEFPALLDLPDDVMRGSGAVEIARLYARYGAEFAKFADAIGA